MVEAWRRAANDRELSPGRRVVAARDSAGTVDLLSVLPRQATGVVSRAVRSEVAEARSSNLPCRRG